MLAETRGTGRKHRHRHLSPETTRAHAPAEVRTQHRIRKAIDEAVEHGMASQKSLKPGEVLFRQGDVSSAFYLIESGEVLMSMVPAAEIGESPPSSFAFTIQAQSL